MDDWLSIIIRIIETLKGIARMSQPFPMVKSDCPYFAKSNLNATPPLKVAKWLIICICYTNLSRNCVATEILMPKSLWKTCSNFTVLTKCGVETSQKCSLFHNPFWSGSISVSGLIHSFCKKIFTVESV